MSDFRCPHCGVTDADTNFTRGETGVMLPMIPPVYREEYTCGRCGEPFIVERTAEGEVRAIYKAGRINPPNGFTAHVNGKLVSTTVERIPIYPRQWWRRLWWKLRRKTPTEFQYAARLDRAPDGGETVIFTYEIKND